MLICVLWESDFVELFLINIDDVYIYMNNELKSRNASSMNNRRGSSSQNGAVDSGRPGSTSSQSADELSTDNILQNEEEISTDVLGQLNHLCLSVEDSVQTQSSVDLVSNQSETSSLQQGIEETWSISHDSVESGDEGLISIVSGKLIVITFHVFHSITE